MLRSVDGPCVLAVDAPWGAGKTTFLRMLSHHLRNQEFPVIEFNAWETDFAGDPFVALSEELTAGLRAYTAATQGDGFNRVKLYKAVAGSDGGSSTSGSRCDSSGDRGDPRRQPLAGEGSRAGPRVLCTTTAISVPGYKSLRSDISNLSQGACHRVGGREPWPTVDCAHRRAGQVPAVLRRRVARNGQASLLGGPCRVRTCRQPFGTCPLPFGPCTVASSMRSAICAGSSTSDFRLPEVERERFMDALLQIGRNRGLLQEPAPQGRYAETTTVLSGNGC